MKYSQIFARQYDMIEKAFHMEEYRNSKFNVNDHCVFLGRILLFKKSTLETFWDMLNKIPPEEAEQRKNVSKFGTNDANFITQSEECSMTILSLLERTELMFKICEKLWDAECRLVSEKLEKYEPTNKSRKAELAKLKSMLFYATRIKSCYAADIYDLRKIIDKLTDERQPIYKKQFKQNLTPVMA